MGTIHILPKDGEGRQPCLLNDSLPLDYMSDHSVMGILVREFDEVVFSADLNQVQGPVKTQFGYHLLEVTSRTD